MFFDCRKNTLKGEKPKMKTTRKILSVCLSFLILLSLAVSGTLAFKSIQQNIDSLSNEQESKLRVSLIKSGDIIDNQNNPDFQILPIREGLSKDEILASEQFVKHSVSVENKGNVEAFVRIVFAFPSSLDSVNEQGNRALHIVGIDSDGWTCDCKNNIQIGTEPYNFYIYTYKDAVGTGDKTQSSAISGFYLDSKVTNNSQGYFLNGEQLRVDQNGQFAFFTRAQAIQADGSNNSNEAFASMALPTFQTQTD